MPTATILGHLGLFVRRGFLSAECCRQIRQEMASAVRLPAMVRPYGQSDGVLDRETRRTGVARMSAPTVALVEDRLRAALPALEEHFHMQLSGWQPLGFYIYEEGDFFRAHRDKDADAMAPALIKERQLSVSILLNNGAGADGDEAHGGGSLVFYGRQDDPGRKWIGIPLQSEEGMFVAFPSHLHHEVKRVTSGRRYSIVTWFT